MPMSAVNFGASPVSSCLFPVNADFGPDSGKGPEVLTSHVAIETILSMSFSKGPSMRMSLKGDASSMIRMVFCCIMSVNAP